MGIYGMGKAFNLRYQQTQAAPRRMNMNTRFQAGPPSLMGFGFGGGQSITNITYNNGPTGFWGFMSGFLNSGILNNLGSGSLFGNQGVRQQQPQGTTTPTPTGTTETPAPTGTTETPAPTGTTETPAPTGITTPTKMRGYAKDNAMLSRLGISSNEKMGRAQWVEANEDGELTTTGSNAEKPETITMKDNTNGRVNTYTYKLLTPEQAEAKGLTGDGPFYVLESVTNGDGTDIKASHEEVFKLNLQKDSDGTYNYNLEQDAGMAGSGTSSIDYTKRF